MPEQYGGQSMPAVMGSAVTEHLMAANQAFSMYHGLTHGAASTIPAHGTEAQKDLFLPKMIACDWTGTMNLTEPQCGTDLGLMRTKATPNADGSYAVTGQKIFISAGEHDLSENIIHLVLAKIPSGPEGIKGVSLFIVPKFLVTSDGNLGPRNAVTCGAIERKMGIHGNATCVMNYEATTGYLLGEMHKGMRAMFTMLNEARLGVGMQGLAQASAAYQNTVIYANERLQGHDVTGVKNSDGPADPLIVHPDIRRRIMDQKSFVEGARAFALWGANMIDQAHRSQDGAADGIQALDLVGRKLRQEGGKHIANFMAHLAHFCDENANSTVLEPFVVGIESASKDLQTAVMYFMKTGTKTPHNALVGSNDFLHLLGHVCLGLMWGEMAKAACAALETNPQDRAFYETKLTTGKYYMTRQLPATALHIAQITSGGDTVMALDVETFSD